MDAVLQKTDKIKSHDYYNVLLFRLGDIFESLCTKIHVHKSAN